MRRALTRRGSAALLSIAAASALLLGACGGDAVPTPAATTTTPGPDERFQTPATLDSYRYTLDVRVGAEMLDRSEAPQGLDLEDADFTASVRGHWVAPNREFSHAEYAFGTLNLQREIIVVGDAVWTRQAEGAWRQRDTLTGPEDLLGQEGLLSPSTLFGNEDPEMLERLTRDLEARPHTAEMLRGRAARRWMLDLAWLEQYRDDFDEILGGVEWPASLDLELWSDTETAVGVRMVLSARNEAGDEVVWMEMDLYDINDPSITVEEPRGAIGP